MKTQQENKNLNLQKLNSLLNSHQIFQLEVGEVTKTFS
jgi:hypothetical protein